MKWKFIPTVKISCVINEEFIWKIENAPDYLEYGVTHRRAAPTDKRLHFHCSAGASGGVMVSKLG